MQFLVLDFETYFDRKDFTLSKMTTEAYVRDPRFQALCLGVHTETGESFSVPRESIQSYLNTVDWSQTCVTAHHAHFDGLILSHHYNVRPAQWICTLSMARMVLGPNQSVSLANLCERFGLAEKSVPYEAFEGKRWENLPPHLRELLMEGSAQDCKLTWELFKILRETFPRVEYPVVDMTVRMFTEPRLLGDTVALAKLQADEWTRKGEQLVHLDVTAAQLQSTEKFCALLEAEGVEIVTKTTNTGNVVPAIAKTDYFMQELLDDPDPRVRGLAEARLDVRSTIDETRAGRLLHMARRGPLTVYLNYCGAQNTMRWSGGDKVNFQNFPRGGGIRKALRAPPGHQLVVGDASQIECRLLNALAGQNSILEAFRAKRDIYSELASQFYGRTITKADKEERQMGKVLELQSGFGSGAATIQRSMRRAPVPVLLSDEEALRARDVYRASHPAVVNLWREAETVLSWLANGTEGGWRIFEIRDKKVYHPNGTWLDYEGLEWRSDTQEYRRVTRRGTSKMYGAKLVENVIQWIARLAISEAAVRLVQMGLRPVNTTHDELMMIVPTEYASQALDVLLAEISRTLPWLPEAPLDAEGFFAERYEK